MADKTPTRDQMIRDLMIADLQKGQPSGQPHVAGPTDVNPNEPLNVIGNYMEIFDPSKDTPGGRAMEAAAQGLGQALTFGHGSQIAAGVLAPISYLVKKLRGGGDESTLAQEYSQIKGASDAATKEVMDKSPIGSAIGLALGISGPVAEGAGLMEQGARSVIKDVAPNLPGWVNRVGAATGTGALLGGAQHAESEGDRAVNATVGGAAGGIFQSLFDAFHGVRRTLNPTPDEVKQKAAKTVFNDLNDITGGQITPETLAQTRREMGSAAMVADLNPALRSTIGSTIANGADPKAAGALVKAAATRNPNEMAWDAITQTLGTEKPRFVNQQEHKAALDQLGTNFKAIVKSMDDQFTVPSADVLKAVDDAFGSNPIGGKRTASNQVLEAIGIKATNEPSGDLLPSDVLEIRQMLDNMIDHASDPMQATAFEKGARANLVQARNSINNMLRDLSPQYAGISRAYSGEFELERARQLGEKLISSPTKQSVEDLRNEFDQFSKAGQQAFREGAGYALFTKAQGSEGLKAATKMTGAPSYREALNTVFGEAKADKFIQQTQTIAEMFKTNNVIEAMKQGRAANLTDVGGRHNPIGQAMDIATAVATGSTGHQFGGAFMGSARRAGAGLTSGAQRAVNTELATLGAQQGLGADEALNSLYDYLRRDMLGQTPVNAGLPATTILNQQVR